MATKTRKKRGAVVRMDATAFRFSTTVSGPTRVVMGEIKRLQIPWQWNNTLHALLVPRQRADDLAAALELAGHRVEMTLPGWS